MIRFVTQSAALLVAVVMSAPLTVANHVDFLVDGSFSQTGSGSPGSVGSVVGSGSNILGQIRYYRVGTLSSFLGSNASAELNTGGPLMLRSDNFAAGDWEFGYGNRTLGQGLGSPLNADFVDNGGANWDSLILMIDVIGADVGNVDGIGQIQVTVSNDADGDQTFASQAVTVDNEGTFVFKYSELPTFDFTNVDGISFQLQSVSSSGTPVLSSDFNISSFERVRSVPEPSSLAGVLLAIGIASTRRTRPYHRQCGNNGAH